MQSTQPIFVNGTAYAISELTLGQAIEIAKIGKGKHEKKISAILSAILNHPTLSYELTLQERHYLVMKYIESKNDVFDFGLNFKDFEKDGLPKECITIGDYTFRHLNGFECEALEEYATCHLDWVMGSIALQASGDGLGGGVLPSHDIKFAKNIIVSRVADLKTLDLGTSENLFNSFFMSIDGLNNLIDYGFDDEGILVKGGADENSVRFCEISTFPRTITEILSGFTN